MSQGLFDKTTSVLGSSINHRLLRQNVISSNIANAETPGYHAKKVDFEEALASAAQTGSPQRIRVSSPRHITAGGISSITPDIYKDPDGAVTPDGNTVNLEKEMANLGENTILYRSALQLINKKLAAMRYAVTEGQR